MPSFLKLHTISDFFKSCITGLRLADVYATIAFYLNHQSEVEAYLQQRRQQSQEIRAMNQARFDPQGLRDRLLARKTKQEAC